MNKQTRLIPFIFATIFLIFHASTAHAACGGQLPSRYNKPINARPVDQGLFNAAVLFYTNKIRCRRGMRQFESQPSELRAAIAHANGMAATGVYSHTIPRRGARNTRERLLAQNIRFRAAGENIAKNFFFIINGRRYLPSNTCEYRYEATRQPIPLHTYATMAQELVDSWENSPGHLANIVNRRMTHMAAAIGLDRRGQLCGVVYASQVFVGYR